MTIPNPELTPYECRQHLLTGIDQTFRANSAASAEYALPALVPSQFGVVEGIGLQVLSGMISTARTPHLLDLIKVSRPEAEYAAVVLRAMGKPAVQHTFILDPADSRNTAVNDRDAIADCVLSGQIEQFAPAPYAEDLFADVVNMPVTLLGTDLAIQVLPYLP